MATASLFEDLLDQYKIEQHIAEKRYTELYQAYDVDDDSPVRLEILRPEFAEDSSFAGRFVNRARAIAQVRHSNIAPILHIGKSADGAPYVAQAAIDGYPLSHRLEQLSRRNTPANPIYALKLIRQLGDALVLAERLELFHHDLQPESVLLKNVTLPTDDSVVLIDLFIPAERNTREKASGGDPETRNYLSPEQRAGKEVTAASHVYSLGAMLYRLLAGKVPGRPVTLRDVGLNRILGRATALERERGDLALATYELVERSLRKDPRRRYADIESFIAALDRALAAEEARLGAAGARGAIVDRRRPMAWLLPLVIMALFLAVGVVAVRSLADQNGADEAALLSRITGDNNDEPPAVATVPAAEPPATIQPTATDEIAAATVSGSSPIAGAVVETATNFAVEATSTPEVLPSSTPTESYTMTPTLPPATVSPRVRVMLNLVNLRRGPGVMYSLLGNVVAGDTLEVIAWNNDKDNPWYLVLTDDQRIGWIAATVVQAESAGALAAVPVAATFPPTPIPSLTPTSTPTNTVVVTVVLTSEPGDPGGGGATRPPEEPTARPTEPPVEPTRTPPPFTPSP